MSYDDDPMQRAYENAYRRMGIDTTIPEGQMSVVLPWVDLIEEDFR